MLLLDIVKERKQTELKKEKVRLKLLRILNILTGKYNEEEKIRKMALEQKRKQENQRASMFKASF